MSLRYGILGLLAEEPMHGYEMKSRYEALLGKAWEVNIGQIYSTLQRLERDGLIEAIGERRTLALQHRAFLLWDR
jgi:DNA-binding PadR family transcriptional regulator